MLGIGKGGGEEIDGSVLLHSVKKKKNVVELLCEYTSVHVLSQCGCKRCTMGYGVCTCTMGFVYTCTMGFGASVYVITCVATVGCKRHTVVVV